MTPAITPAMTPGKSPASSQRQLIRGGATGATRPLNRMGVTVGADCRVAFASDALQALQVEQLYPASPDLEQTQALQFLSNKAHARAPDCEPLPETFLRHLQHVGV